MGINRQWTGTPLIPFTYHRVSYFRVNFFHNLTSDLSNQTQTILTSVC